MVNGKNQLFFIFDLDGVLIDTLPFFNIICAVMINDALQKMTQYADKQFTTFDEIYNEPEIIGSIFPEKLEWVMRKWRLPEVTRDHPIVKTAWNDMRDIADELIAGQTHLAVRRAQGPSILRDLRDRHLIDTNTGHVRIMPFAGVAKGLQTLLDAGATLGVASTNHQARTEGLLKIAGLSQYFASVTGTTLPGIEPELRAKSATTPDVYLAQYAKMIGISDWRSLLGEDLSHVTGIEDSASGGSAVRAANMRLVGICHDAHKFAAEKASLREVGAQFMARNFGTLVPHLLRNKIG